MENHIQQLLAELGAIDGGAVEELYPRVRDRDDVKVMRCRKTGVIFLSKPQLMDEAHYATMSDLSYWSATTRTDALRETADDDQRRAVTFGPLIRGRKWLDFGTGMGGVLDLLRDEASEIWAVELQVGSRKELNQMGYHVFQSVDELPANNLEVVTLFHVFEHLTEPIQTLRAIAMKMAPQAKLVVEVPHARDFLIDFLELEKFKAFTFWSEHLILHTRQSLELFLHAAGFRNVQIAGFQRYPLANHLHWLAEGKPGGHQKWSMLRSPELDKAYAALLDRLDQTDTLIAIAEK